MKYAYYNETSGDILGFYDDQIHNSIPTPNIQLTHEQWQGCINNQGLRAIDVVTAKLIDVPRRAFSAEQFTQAAQQAVQDALDKKAQEREYDGILSLCSYATSAVDKFKLEGQAGVVWRDGAWSALYQLQADIADAKVPAPTSIEESKALALSVLPVMHWPDEGANDD